MSDHYHHDLEREDERLKALLDQWQAHLRELREDLRGALERIRALEDRQPDYSDPEAGDEPDPSRCPARGPFTGPVPRLRRLRPMGACCDRAVYDDSTGWWCPEHGDQEASDPKADDEGGRQ